MFSGNAEFTTFTIYITFNDITFLGKAIAQFKMCTSKSVNYSCFLHNYFEAVPSESWPRKKEILEFISHHLPKSFAIYNIIYNVPIPVEKVSKKVQMERYQPFQNSLEARQFDSVMLCDNELKIT